MKRIFDIIASSIGIILLFPVYLSIVLAIKLTSKGSFLYKQKRVGVRGKDFYIFKFRTMYLDSDKKGLLTVGDKDPRVTYIGYYLRKFKLDELPQLFNVLIGDMSIVGPRPEVRRYVDLYSPEDMIVLSIRPGITDYASIHFRNENEILKGSANPEQKYIDEIMPIKLNLNKKYVQDKGFFKDILIIFKTFYSIIK
jgi:lipopolysaccharide/colanic/teichoic acid biosynthesis glycosyltransferase